MNQEQLKNKYEYFEHNLAFFDQVLRPCIVLKDDCTFEDTPCWLWDICQTKGGYGIYYHQKGIFTMHRLTYTIFNGLAEEGLDIDHKCNCRSCFNPLHLEAVTHQENCRRRDERNPRPKKPQPEKKIRPARKHPKKVPRSKTHCKNGHLRTPENTCHVRQHNKLTGEERQKIRCRDCTNTKAREYKAEAREQYLKENPGPRIRVWLKPAGHGPVSHFKCGHEATAANSHIRVIYDKEKPREKRSCLTCHNANLKGRGKKFCINGHEYTPENTKWINLADGTQKKDCIECIKARKERYEAAHPYEHKPRVLKEYCGNGHEYTPENTRVATLRDGSTKRDCKACDRERGARYREAQKAKKIQST